MAKMVLAILFVGLVASPCYAGILAGKAAAVGAAGAAVLAAEAIKEKLEHKSEESTTVSATADAQTLLSAPVVDIKIKKEPLLTVTDAPCTNVCKDKCTITMEKKCSDVPVVTKECTPAKKTLFKKVCSKKCTLVVKSGEYIKSVDEETPQVPAQPPTTTPEPTEPTPEPETPELPPQEPNPSKPPTEQPNPSKPPYEQPNPSKPPYEQPNPSKPPSEQPNPSKPPTEQPNPSKPLNAEAVLPAVDLSAVQADIAAATGGRQLQGLLHVAAAAGGAAVVAKGVVATKAVEAVVMTKLIKSLPVPSCDDVCKDHSFEWPDLHCESVTHVVQHCDEVPKKVCEQECVCIPQKTVSLNLPKKGLTITKDA